MLKIVLYVIAMIALLMLIALTSRMHVFLAIPVIVIAMFGFALLGILLDN